MLNWRKTRSEDKGLLKDWIIISNGDGEQDKTLETDAENNFRQQKDLEIVTWKW